MSLINDALKRAKTAQQQAEAPAPSGPQLRPVEPAQAARRGLGLALPVTCVVIALLGLFLLWQLASNRGKESQASSASGEPIAVVARTAAPAPTTEITKPAPSPAASAPTTAAPTAPTQTVSNVVTTGSAVVDSSSNVTSVAEAPPKPAPLKLQGIVYNPTHPSATISGRTVFVGDRVGGFRVIAIDKDSATLVGGGQTNLLNLLE